MVILISSTSATIEAEFGHALPTTTMEDTVGYVPPTNQPVLTAWKVPLRPSRETRGDVLGHLVSSKGKCTMNRKRKEQQQQCNSP